MATVTGYTAARMKQIEDKAITSGTVVSGNLILYPKNYPVETSINAGSVIGPAGPTGPAGSVNTGDLNTAVAVVNDRFKKVPSVMNKLPSTSKQVITHDIKTPISFTGADDWDTSAFHTSTDLRKFVVPAGAGGIYQVTWNAFFTSASFLGGTRYISISKNSVTAANEFAQFQQDHINTISNLSLGVTEHILLIPGDYLVANAYHFTGGTNQSVHGTFHMQWMSEAP